MCVLIEESNSTITWRMLIRPFCIIDNTDTNDEFSIIFPFLWQLTRNLFRFSRAWKKLRDKVFIYFIHISRGYKIIEISKYQIYGLLKAIMEF